ncbi:uncharacterized protein PV09_09602 [Verruconis gallopava]|uniref:Zn(2)-C6 fungal-type domain-containing protein n=1 Tax=Verruconis gallopava TaxID=253628 RepID=A0A0D1ZX43_9PEZI|nr:uncharacterized protein PV09_09602 [Verruconis gallopava]KIV98609.1 hypothetical protein PV09_09602 [Verruconis gallopava]
MDPGHENRIRSPSAGQMFGSFNSPSALQTNGKASPESQPTRKRKHAGDHDGDPGHAHYQDSGANSYSQSNPDLDSYIKSKRKPREKKACQVCRKRKVACDQQQPCLNCIERRYPELCIYENSTEHVPNRSDIGTSTATHQGAHREVARNASLLTPAETSLGFSPEKLMGDTVTMPRDSFEKLMAKLEHFQRSTSDLNAEIRGLINVASVSSTDLRQESGASGPSHFNGNALSAGNAKEDSNLLLFDGIHSKNELTGQTVHVGGNSVPAFVMQYSSQLEDLLGTNVLPAFGLENESATYPFVSLSDLRQGRLARVIEMCKTLPPEQDIDRYFSSFRDISGVVYPAVANIEKFESELFEFHLARAEALSHPVPYGIDEQSAYGKKLNWIGLLFATLASGCQCTDVSVKELDLASRVFVCCSFECLRMTNFLSNPSLETIQTLLVLGNVISNTMNAGVAWSLLGMTTRLAQVLGLHRPCRESIPQNLKDDRCKIAWTMMWQESLLSITFDRAPASASIFYTEGKGLPYDSYAADGSFSYAGCMYQVTKVGLELLQDRGIPRSTNDMLHRMQHYEQLLRQIMSNAAAHLKSSQHCQSLQEQLQHWALYLHTSYIMSEVCREAIKPKIAQTELAMTMRQTCLDSLTNTVRAFLGLNRLTAFASHSWSALSRGLSSALVLGILGHGEKNEEVHALLNQLLMLLHEVMARNSDGATELSTPIKRWIATLTRLTGGKSVRQGSSASTSTSPFVELDSDESPYTQADSIIWGPMV